jgi:hypothetical protein
LQAYHSLAKPGISKCFYNFKKSNSYMTRFSHLSFKKCTTTTKVSTSTLHIQRSKLIMKVVHESKVGDTNLALFFFAMATFGKRSSFYWHLDGKLRQGFCPKINLWKDGASKINNIISLVINSIISSSNYFWWRSCQRLQKYCKGLGQAIFCPVFVYFRPIFCCSIQSFQSYWWLPSNCLWRK